MAQKGFNVQKEMIIDVPASELWEMVGPGFVEVYKWSSNVDHAEGQGTSKFEGAACNERFCDVNVILECLVLLRMLKMIGPLFRLMPIVQN